MKFYYLQNLAYVGIIALAAVLDYIILHRTP
jgi:low affinity Fe/Cu permease